MPDPTAAELAAAGELYAQLARRPAGTVVAHQTLPLVAWRDSTNDIFVLHDPQVVADRSGRLTVSGRDILGDELEIATRGAVARSLRPLLAH